MAKSNPLVSVIVLNWNRPHDTLKCIESIKKQTYKKFEIIIVDNGSIDKSISILKKVKDIKLVINPINRGFTGGHIDGLSHSSGEYIFVLNNDAVVDENYIKNAVDILDKDEKIAVVGGRSYQWTSENEVFDSNAPYFAFQNINRISMEGIFNRIDAGYNHETNWVSGSAMVIRKRAIDKVGYLFDPMFAYYEECDLFARMQAYDYKIVYSPFLRIWHKDGASSSSYFQLNQLFKNRFVYAIRNLEAKDFARFLKSYSRTMLRGSYHLIARRDSSPDSKIMNKALHDALVSSVLTWPKWFFSRKGLARRDSKGYNLKDRLKIEQTGISFVCDLSGNIKALNKLTDFIKTITYSHYNSEIVLVCDSQEEEPLIKLINSNDIDNLGVRIVTNAKKTKVNPINLGWLSASKQYIWFINEQYQPTIDTVNALCANMPEGEFAISAESTDDDINLAEPKLQMTNNICLSRSLLSLYGGIDNKNSSLSLSAIYYLANKLNRLSVCNHPISHSSRKQLREHTINADIISKTKLIIHGYKDQGAKNSIYNRVIAKYYRLYQLNNISQWLFIGDIPGRLKLARIRNSLLASIKLDRKNLALELRHINNEVVKSKHSGLNQEKNQLELKSIINNQTKNNNWKRTPIFVICRDRVSPLKLIVKWLEEAEMTNIILIDNASAYPPLLEYYKKTPYQVIKTNKNIGHTVVWKEGFAKTLFPGEFYIVTDPDVIPDEKAPKDSVKYFYELHKKYLHYQKIGFGLQIDNLPDHYSLKSHVIEWESQFWNNEIESNIFEAGIDTTFALYKPYTNHYTLHPSIRTGAPYTAKHLPWYTDSKKIDKEEAFYRLHASQNITSWNTDEILDRYKKELAKKIQ